ncbi:Conserved_hypothetical protein [Hexamita inflata]|uniref:Uncharacterized protein n=1 Tax=Hexamita inflata TaxID=28002 RepID=A0AA86TWN0_9EUKA|nr:Conserved hypothetical protein [Hexamita inflata]CAI9931975.1 Conserved hypothetical protein [Hexamita inflata]CAI9969354.1 Conserved hypothetical protein [Hexamita inflata]
MDTKLYDRQIRAFGADFNCKIQMLRICVVGEGILFEELSKQLVLLGINTIYTDCLKFKLHSRTKVLKVDQINENTVDYVISSKITNINIPHQHILVQPTSSGYSFKLSSTASEQQNIELTASQMLMAANTFMFWFRDVIGGKTNGIQLNVFKYSVNLIKE